MVAHSLQTNAVVGSAASLSRVFGFGDFRLGDRHARDMRGGASFHNTQRRPPQIQVAKRSTLIEAV